MSRQPSVVLGPRGPRPVTARFGLLVLHDDGEREFAYDAGAEKALAAASTHGWAVASMRDDFGTVF